MGKTAARNNDTTANLGFEAKLWQMADAMVCRMIPVTSNPN